MKVVHGDQFTLDATIISNIKTAFPSQEICPQIQEPKPVRSRNMSLLLSSPTKKTPAATTRIEASGFALSAKGLPIEKTLRFKVLRIQNLTQKNTSLGSINFRGIIHLSHLNYPFVRRFCVRYLFCVSWNMVYLCLFCDQCTCIGANPDWLQLPTTVDVGSIWGYPKLDSNNIFTNTTAPRNMSSPPKPRVGEAFHVGVFRGEVCVTVWELGTGFPGQLMNESVKMNLRKNHGTKKGPTARWN